MRSVLLSIALALLAGAAQAADVSPPPAPLSDSATFVNETPIRVLHVYIWRQGNQPWLEDALGDQFIEPGREVKIQVLEGAWCVYDYEVEFVDQRRVSGRVDLCRDPVVRLTP